MFLNQFRNDIMPRKRSGKQIVDCSTLKRASETRSTEHPVRKAARELGLNRATLGRYVRQLGSKNSGTHNNYKQKHVTKQVHGPYNGILMLSIISIHLRNENIPTS